MNSKKLQMGLFYAFAAVLAVYGYSAMNSVPGHKNLAATEQSFASTLEQQKGELYLTAKQVVNQSGKSVIGLKKEATARIGQYDGMLGLRFEGVVLPQDAKISSASLDVTPIASSSGTAFSVKIYQENPTTSVLPFSTEHDIASRLLTTQFQSYTSQIAWRKNEPLTMNLVNLLPVLAQVKTGSVNFVIQGADAKNSVRVISARDAGAPRLHVLYTY